jgi:hypothetical protein
MAILRPFLTHHRAMAGDVNRNSKARLMFGSVFAILWLVSAMLLSIIVLRRALRVALWVWSLFETGVTGRHSRAAA